MKTLVPWAGNVTLALVYLFAAALGRSGAPSPAEPGFIWLPAGIALAGLLLGGYRLWPGVAAGALATALASGVPPAAALGVAAANTASGLVAAYLVRGLGNATAERRRFRATLVSVALAALLAPLVSAAGSAVSLSAAGVVPLGEVGRTGLAWWLAAALGTAVVTPAVLAWDERGRELTRTRAEARRREEWLGAFLRAQDRERTAAEVRTHFLADAGAALATLADPEGGLQKLATLAVPPFADGCAIDLAGPGGPRRVASAGADPTPVDVVARVLLTGKVEAAAPAALCVPLLARGEVVGAISLCREADRPYDAADRAAADELARRVSIALENARLFAEVREADRRKQEFLAMLGHELRNPLAPIRNALHILKMTNGRGATQAVEIIDRQAVTLVRLVDDLLDVSRLMRGGVPVRRQRVALADVVARALEGARPILDAGGHQLSVALPARPIWLEADPVRLAQALANLLDNAARYTRRAGRIWLTGRREGSEVVLRVRDTGIGIRGDMLTRIFDLFVQADGPLDRIQGGLGVGLTVVRALVGLHGGSVTALSDGPSKGSEFVVRLPALTDDDEAADPTTPMTESTDVLRRVLVVDDNVDAADSLGMVLRLEGHEVRIAHDGSAALAVAREFRPDLILLDIGMPDMDGYEVARRLRQEPGLEGVVLAALTGWGQDEDHARTREAGFDHHLVKPVGVAVLHGLLSSPITQPAQA